MWKVKTRERASLWCTLLVFTRPDGQCFMPRIIVHQCNVTGLGEKFFNRPVTEFVCYSYHIFLIFGTVKLIYIYIYIYIIFFFFLISITSFILLLFSYLEEKSNLDSDKDNDDDSYSDDSDLDGDNAAVVVATDCRHH